MKQRLKNVLVRVINGVYQALPANQGAPPYERTIALPETTCKNGLPKRAASSR
jgi:hypothetical protein